MDKNELLEGATQAETGYELWQLFLRYAETERIARVSYHHHGIDAKWGSSAPKAEPGTLRNAIEDVSVSPTPSFHIAAHGFPREWVDKYVDDRLYEIDPIPEIALRTSDPFLWSQTADLAKLAEDQAAYLATLEGADVGDGVAIQVFGPNMRHGYVGLGFGETGRKVTAAKLAEYQIVAQLLHLRFCTIVEARNASEVDLSPREREILSWMARGKSKSVIAEILGVSVHTVDTLVRRMFRKLDVSDRTSAVLKAVNLGLVPAMAGSVT